MTVQFRGKRRAVREANFLSAAQLDDGKWIKATPYHWRRKLQCGHVIDFWPTTMKAQFAWFNPDQGCHDLELSDNAFGKISGLLDYEVAE